MTVRLFSLVTLSDTVTGLPLPMHFDDNDTFERHILFPLPGNALSVNEALEQNTGY